MVQETTEKIKLIVQRLKTAQSRQKSYADVKRKPIEFEIDDYVFLRVKPRHSIIRFENKGKLALRYIGSYRVIEKIGTVAYHLDLPPKLEHIHNVFRVSMLRRYIANPPHILPTDEIVVDEKGTYETYPVRIQDRKEHDVNLIPMIV